MHDSEALKANPQLPDSGPASTAQTTRMRLDFVDSLRALAALAVVLLHSYEAFGLGHRPNVLGDHWFEQFLESTYPVAFRGNYGVRSSLSSRGSAS